MNDLEMAAKFREAAAYFRKNGWQQFLPGVDGGPRCATGGLRSIVGDLQAEVLDLSVVAGKRVAAPLNKALFAPFDRAQLAHLDGDWLHQAHLIQWNNTPGRTKEDVISLFEGLAHDLELRHQITISTAASSQEAILPTLKEAVLSA